MHALESREMGAAMRWRAVVRSGARNVGRWNYHRSLRRRCPPALSCAGDALSPSHPLHILPPDSARHKPYPRRTLASGRGEEKQMHATRRRPQHTGGEAARARLRAVHMGSEWPVPRRRPGQSGSKTKQGIQSCSECPRAAAARAPRKRGRSARQVHGAAARCATQERRVPDDSLLEKRVCCANPRAPTAHSPRPPRPPAARARASPPAPCRTARVAARSRRRSSSPGGRRGLQASAALSLPCQRHELAERCCRWFSSSCGGN